MNLNNKFGSYFHINRYWTRDYLLIHFRTSAVVVIDGIDTVVEPGSMILYHIDCQQHYYANQDTYIDDFIHFSIEEDYPIFKHLGIPFNTVIKLPSMSLFSLLLSTIHNEFISENINRNTTINYLMKVLFNKIGDFIGTNVKDNNGFTYYEILHKLRDQIYSYPEKNWSLIEMAKYCNLSASYLQILYKQAFHITCINDVINSKMQLAKGLLSMTDDTIKKIAYQCGYHNDEYFMRQFKKCTGYTPSQYRRDHMLIT